MTMARRTWSQVILSAIAVGAIAVAVRAQALPDLGTSEAAAREQAIQSIFGGTIPWIGVAVFKAASPVRRTALAQGAVAWAKVFVQSAAFRTAYETVRTQSRPEPPQVTSGDPVQEQRAEFDKSVAEMRANMAGQSPEIRKAIEDTIKQMQEQMDAQLKNPEMMKLMRDAAVAERAQRQEEYAKRIREFDAAHPTDPRAAVVAVLQRFIEVSGTVDFDAKLVKSQGGKMVFANPDYESRSSEWKMCFRAGREPLAAARAAVQVWLRELGR